MKEHCLLSSKQLSPQASEGDAPCRLTETSRCCTALTSLSLLCRYAVPAESAAAFEAALQQQQGPDAAAQLTAKHLYCSLPVQLLKQLGVRRFLQMPGYAFLTYPVSFRPLACFFSCYQRLCISSWPGPCCSCSCYQSSCVLSID